MTVIEMGSIKEAHKKVVDGQTSYDENLPECGMVIRCTREELKELKENPLFRRVTLNVGKPVCHICINGIHVDAEYDSFINITWDGEKIGEKKDYTAQFKVIDSTHVYGTAPYYMGLKRCADCFHLYYLPCKNAVKAVEFRG